MLLFISSLNRLSVERAGQMLTKAIEEIIFVSFCSFLHTHNKDTKLINGSGRSMEKEFSISLLLSIVTQGTPGWLFSEAAQLVPEADSSSFQLFPTSQSQPYNYACQRCQHQPGSSQGPSSNLLGFLRSPIFSLCSPTLRMKLLPEVITSVLTVFLPNPHIKFSLLKQLWFLFS